MKLFLYNKDTVKTIERVQDERRDTDVCPKLLLYARVCEFLFYKIKKEIAFRIDSLVFSWKTLQPWTRAGGNWPEY